MPKESTIVFGGDCCPARSYERQILSGQDIFDSSILKLFREADFSMVNLECPLCLEGLPATSLSGYGLRASPKVAAYLKTCNIRAVGLANNHIRDFGDAGVISTLSIIDKLGILRTGAECNCQAAEKLLTFELNDTHLGIWALAEQELNLAARNRPGAAHFFPELNTLKISQLKQSVDLLILYIHAGHEFTDVPSPRIRDAFRTFIDAGANVIIGHHPHVPQGIEEYGRGLICYSLGNLVFDSQYVSQYDHTGTGYLLQLGVSNGQLAGYETIPYHFTPGDRVFLLNDRERSSFNAYLEQLSGYLDDK